MTKHILSILLFFPLSISCRAGGRTDTTLDLYNAAYHRIEIALEQPGSCTFKDICFLTENTYFNGGLDSLKFNTAIRQLASIVTLWVHANPVRHYPFEDSLNFQKNYGIFKLLKDTIRFLNTKGEQYATLPYSYDFADFFGQHEWSNMFVVKLLASHKGNCHSLPYLYKILADELGATCWLALAPNHIYIKTRSEKVGWYNTELTSGSFPVDGWMMASGYLPLQAIQKGIYMDTLSEQQAIALCAVDLAKGNQHLTKRYADSFALRCCDLSLKYFPLNVQAILLKAEILKRMYEKQRRQNQSTAISTFQKMQALYIELYDLGYREMPDKMYQDWLQSVMKEKNKYQNSQVTGAIQPKAG